jgi:hypothetical protein
MLLRGNDAWTLQRPFSATPSLAPKPRQTTIVMKAVNLRSEAGLPA